MKEITKKMQRHKLYKAMDIVDLVRNDKPVNLADVYTGIDALVKSGKLKERKRHGELHYELN